MTTIERNYSDTLQTISPDQLKKKIEAHAVWLKSGRKEGTQCDLQRTNLRGCDLSDADLAEAILTGAELSEANLANAQLQRADLSHANLKNVHSLMPDQLAGANLRDAKLPEQISKFDELAQVVELSKMGKTLFASMLLGCVYSWLTIFSTTDAHLLTNSTSSPLPIIQTPIPIAGFFAVAPFILLALFTYFHLYLARLWRQLASLPAVFPDGKSLDEKAYPWLINSLLRSYIPRLKTVRPPLSRLEVGASILLAWWVVPLTVALFWLRSLQKHDPILTGFLIVFMLYAAVSASWFQHLAKWTFRGQPLVYLEPTTEKRLLLVPKKSAMTLKHVTIGVLVGLLAFTVSDGVFNATKPESKNWITDRYGYVSQDLIGNEEEKDESNIYRVTRFHREVTPRFLPYIGARAFANLTEQSLSTKPPNWFLQPDDEMTRIVQGAELKGANLQQVSARAAFLIKADLREAQLQAADLREAQLQAADLREAQLQAANLREAQLQGATLRGANLQKAALLGAKLQKANMIEVQLQGAILYEAQLQEATLDRAQLQETDLRRAHLQKATLIGAQLQKANLEGAQLQKATLRGAKLQGAILDGADLQGATLDGAWLQGATLRGAKLQGANLDGAELAGANLDGAQIQGAILGSALLTNVTGLTQAQINQACTNFATILPRQLSRPNPCKTP